MEEKGNQTGLRERNTVLVRSALKAERSATKLRLARLTGLSTVTVGAALDLLTARGEASEGPMTPSGGGRPARSYVFEPGYRHALCLYIRGTTLFSRVEDLYGTCVHRDEEPLPSLGGDSLMPTLRRLLEDWPSVGAVSIGVPGVELEGVMAVSDRPELAGVRLTERYRQAFGLPVAVENDVNLAVLGYCGRAGVDTGETVAYLYFPEKGCPGAGLRLEGGLYRGRHKLAGEIKGLPPALDWAALDWTDFDRVCAALSSVASAYACILDPDRLVLQGPGLTETHLDAVRRNCAQALETGFLPRLCLSGDFDGDYEAGALRHALTLLEGERTWPLFS